MKYIPLSICNEIYDILVEHASAPEQVRDDFLNHYGNPDNTTQPTEFRVCHKWGLAGKFWWANDRFYVSGRSRCECPSEEAYLEEAEECDTVNDLLLPLYDAFCYFASPQHSRLPEAKVATTLELHSALPEETLAEIPKLEQYQGSLNDQLIALERVAVRLGLRDAADYIRRQLGED